VAYEILTGTLPGDPEELRPNLPETVARSVRKAMSFRPELRHAETREFSEELYQTLTGGERSRKTAKSAVVALVLIVSVAVVFWLERSGKSFQSVQDQTSIAVLPFADMSPEKNQEFFSEGLAEELLNELANTPGLRVVARTSSFQSGAKSETHAPLAGSCTCLTSSKGACVSRATVRRLRRS
jgi:hypothetical protein